MKSFGGGLLTVILSVTLGALFPAATNAMTQAQKTEVGRAEKLMQQRRPVEASEILTKLLRENPEVPGVRYQAALAAQMTGDSTKAATLAAQALERKEETSELQVLVGVLAMQEKKYPEARRAFERAVELNPSNSIALYNLSEALREQGRPQEAMVKLEQAIKLEPEKNLLQLKLRLAQMETGKGFEELEQEISLRQNDADQTYDWLMTAAAVHLKNGNYRQASEAIREAKEVAGSRKIGPIFAKDHFFRQFAEIERLKEIRKELGLE